MWKICIRKSCIDKSRIVISSHSIEQIIGSFGTLHRLLFRAVKVLKAHMNCFIKVHDSQVVETAENIEMYIVFHELQLWVERVVPNNLQVINCNAKLFVPVEVFAHKHSVFDIHFNCWDVLVNYFDRRFVVLKRGNFISELSYLRHDLSEGKCSLLVLSLF